jgi:hypothetical protein
MAMSADQMAAQALLWFAEELESALDMQGGEIESFGVRPDAPGMGRALVVVLGDGTETVFYPDDVLRDFKQWLEGLPE